MLTVRTGAMGPSPRVRGSPNTVVSRSGRSGSIPACAGKPPSSFLQVRRHRVHPRVCGEAPSMASTVRRCSGPSPRVRGSRAEVPHAGERAGSIPACAGKPRYHRAGCPRPQVHPRVCGEARRARPARPPEAGPSPRVRGSRHRRARVRGGPGSIPACAGKPWTIARGGSTSGVHPRVCGEAGARPGHPRLSRGPSPRVRGSRRRDADAGAEPGSIPACAGKPRTAAARIKPFRVHPRVCGEAAVTVAGRVTDRGPSPRVRGSPGRRLRAIRISGSIPACAGKPDGFAVRPSRRRVHPRVCGEALPAAAPAEPSQGPSPRVRGSRRSLPAPPCRAGSIPACAGKPSPGGARPTACRVHPRVCGEADDERQDGRGYQGPSPRVRGSRRRRQLLDGRQGSIPACAGKPPDMDCDLCGARVHPRVCGEAREALAGSPLVGGPSPRVRGSPLAVLHGPERIGSIPACAGKPRSKGRVG